MATLTYSILERIGRSREQGQNTLGKVSLRACKISPKDLFYHRKALLKHGLVIKQVTSIRVNNCNTHSLLFHLPRFYVEYRPLYLKSLHQIVIFLKSRNNGVATFEEILENCDAVQDSKLLRNFFKKKLDFAKIINIESSKCDYVPTSSTAIILDNLKETLRGGDKFVFGRYLS